MSQLSFFLRPLQYHTLCKMYINYYAFAPTVPLSLLSKWKANHRFRQCLSYRIHSSLLQKMVCQNKRKTANKKKLFLDIIIKERTGKTPFLFSYFVLHYIVVYRISQSKKYNQVQLAKVCEKVDRIN